MTVWMIVTNLPGRRIFENDCGVRCDAIRTKDGLAWETTFTNADGEPLGVTVWASQPCHLSSTSKPHGNSS